MAATVVAISTSETKGVRKENVGQAELEAGHGIRGDAHAGPWHRQISLLALESIERMRAKGLDVHPGDFAENLTTRGICLHTLPVGTLLGIGDKVIGEVSQIGKKCYAGCAIFKEVGDCVMPREGIFIKVTRGGSVKVGDPVKVMTDV